MKMFEGVRNGTPDCEVVSHEDETCVWMSVVRLRTECNGCGHVRYRFVCARHYRGLQVRQVRCYHCKSEKLRVMVS